MKKHRIVFATGNAGKMKEIRLIMADLGCEVVSMKEAGADPEIVENGTSFAENAEIKARAVWNCTGDIVLADDSGLVVDYIGGEPGIYSARYMGEDTSYEIKNRNIIDRLADAKGEERSARFVCNIAAVLPDGRVLHTEAAMEGQIAMEPAGCGRFWLRPDPVSPGVWHDFRGNYHGAEECDQPPRKGAGGHEEGIRALL